MSYFVGICTIFNQERWHRQDDEAQTKIDALDGVGSAIERLYPSSWFPPFY